MMNEKGRAWISKLPGILFLFLILFLISWQYRQEEREESKEEKISAEQKVPAEIAEEFFPGHTELVQESEVLIRVEKGRKVVGSFIVTTSIADGVTGFAGKVPVVLALNTEGKIIGLRLLENQESPGFIKRIARKGFFDSWNDKTPEEALELQVEAVSGATLSSEAVKENVRRALTYYLQREAEGKEVRWMDLLKNGLGFVLVMFALLSMFPIKILKKYRWVLMAGSVLILGFWNGYFLSFTLLYGWLTHGIPWGGKILLLVMAFLAFFIPLFFGKSYYCYYLCPFGAAQELAGKIRKKKTIPKGYLKIILKYSRWVYFSVVVGLLLVGVTLDLTLFEPLAAFMFNAAGRWILALALTFLFLSVFFSRPWCNYFCLTGQLLEIIRRGKVNKSNRRIWIEWSSILILVALVLFVVW